MACHVADRPFACPSCSLRFARNNDLQRHIRSKHAPSPVRLTCPLCEIQFRRADGLKRHIDVVHSKTRIKTEEMLQ
eukprot:jgi/Hompol1/2624/HPOL_006084-RA